MANLAVTPEADNSHQSKCNVDIYEINRIDDVPKSELLVFNKEYNILYEYIYNNRDGL